MNKKPKKVRMTVLITPELHQIARVAAAKAACSLSKFVVRLIEKELGNESTESNR